MKAVVAAFNQEKGEGPSRGLLRDYEPSDAIRMQLFEALVVRSQELIVKVNRSPPAADTAASCTY